MATEPARLPDCGITEEHVAHTAPNGALCLGFTYVPPDPKPLWQREAEKFHAETLTTAFLADRLRRAKGAAVLCDRCKANYGTTVFINDRDREWLCGRCLGEPERGGPFRV